jgi:glycosyltransferase involved in cell wall biosynthesis
MISFNQVGHGTYLRTNEFARELAHVKHQVTVVADSKKRRAKVRTWQNQGMKIVEFPSAFYRFAGSGWDPYSIYSRLNWLKVEDYDIVHGFESRPSVIFPAMALKKKGLPLVLDWCDWFGKGGSVEERPNKVLKTLYRPLETHFEDACRSKADANTVICNKLYKRAIDLEVNCEKLKIIRNGYNMRGWGLISKSLGRDFFGYHQDDFIIGYVGALFPKDAALMAKAFKKVLQQLPNAKLLHLGRSDYGSKFCHPSVKIAGLIDELTLRKGLAACDVCWLPLSDIPANWGRFPLKFSAYLSAGKPIIVTEVGDIPDIVKKYQTGITCIPDPVSLAENTLLLASKPEKIRFYSAEARKLSQNPEESWENRTKELLKFYKLLT